MIYKTIFRQWFVIISVVFVSLLSINNSYAAQQSILDPQVASLPSTEIEDFKRLLADPKVQDWLQQSMPATDAEQNFDQQQGFRESFGLLLQQIRERKLALIVAWDQAAQAPAMIVQKWQSQMSTTETLRAIIYILIFLFVGAGLEWLYAQYSGYKLLQLELRKPQSLKSRVQTAFYRALLTFAGLFFFALGSIGVFLSFNWPSLVEYLVLEILIVILTVRLGTTVTRFFLAPKLKELRLVPLSGAQAKRVHFWAGVMIFIMALNMAVATVFDQLIKDVPGGVLSHSALSINLINNLVLMLVAQFALWRIYLLFNTHADGSGNRAICKFWTLYFSFMFTVIYVLWTIDTPVLMKSLIIIGLLIPLTHLFRNWINYLFDQAEHKYQHVRQHLIEQRSAANAEPSADAKPSADGKPSADQEANSEQDEDEDEESAVHPYQNYRPIARRLMRFVLVVIAIFSLAIVWGHNLFALSSSSSMTAKFFSVSIDIIAALLIADLIWVWAKTYIDKRLADYEPPEEGHAPGPEARMATLLPLLRSMLIVTLISMVVFSVLASLGFNIGPLLAGAGVIGLAIGFGAQTLVKDVVSGIFYLIDDAFRIGEYIEVGDLRGTVESMSVRSLRVRHHRGAVHTIPFGELSAITNHSRDWVIMKLEFRIPFDTNMKLVKKLIKKIGKELLTNEDFGHCFIQPLKSQGVRRMEEFNMVLGVKFMTRPGEQWVIRREAYHKIRDTFEANGIGLAERNVKVQVLNLETLDEPTKQAVAGAAQNTVEQQLPPGPIPDEP
ncbi:hypothetical protein A9R01_00835 ['Osedax' symbiont bacterium Rs2_46_30_T18]|nr:hypothetical protein A9R01_00835 ['Osedax' symbiont bacterium Rs2_46_30_T18]